MITWLKKKIIYEIGEKRALQALSQAQEEIKVKQFLNSVKSTATAFSDIDVVKSKWINSKFESVKSHKQSI
jgi:hypothetical protein